MAVTFSKINVNFHEFEIFFRLIKIRLIEFLTFGFQYLLKKQSDDMKILWSRLNGGGSITSTIQVVTCKVVQLNTNNIDTRQVCGRRWVINTKETKSSYCGLFFLKQD